MKKECVDLIKNNPYRLLEPRPFWSAYPKRCFEGPPGHVVHLACLRLCLRLLGSQVWIILSDLKVLYTDINRKNLTWNKIQNSVKSTVCLQMILSSQLIVLARLGEKELSTKFESDDAKFYISYLCVFLLSQLVSKFDFEI